MNKQVVIIEGHWPSLMPEGPLIEREVLGKDADVERVGIPNFNDHFLWENVSAIIVRPGTLLTRDMILKMKKIKIIVSLGVGYDHISLTSANERKIPVCHIPHYCTEEVADTTLTMLLVHYRKLFLYHHLNTPVEGWNWRSHVPISRTSQVKVGIVGLGRIGKAVTKRLQAFGFKISFYDPFIEDSPIAGIHRISHINNLLSSSDIVTIHTPLNEQTKELIDEKFFKLLKPNAIVLNTARGGIFKSTDVLYHALKTFPELRIGADTWPEEPPLDHPLLQAWLNHENWLRDRLLIYPHTAFYSVEALHDLRYLAAALVKDVLNGKKPYHVVNNLPGKI